ncbi:MAG: transglycosylase domain-containing protein, partial [Marinibacterium sp.]|nr:transglycosylase domain-containing protein [Marinibacterium sp.]
MSDSSRKKPPLRADRRYATQRRPSNAAAKAPTKRKAKPAAKRKPARKPARKSGARRGGGSGGGVFGRIFGFFGGIIRGILRLIWGFSWRVALVIGLIIAGAVGYTYSTLPAYETLLDGRSRGSVTLLDRNGEVFAWRGDQFGGVVTADTVSPNLKNAIIATEDKRFYRHFGVSPRGVASAVRINLREGRGPLSG